MIYSIEDKSFRFSDEVSSEGTNDAEPDSLRELELEQGSESDSGSESESEPSPRKFPRPFPPTVQKIFAGIHRKGESLQKDQVVQDFDSVEEFHFAQ